MPHPKESTKTSGDDDIITAYGEYDIIQGMELLVRVKLSIESPCMHYLTY